MVSTLGDVIDVLEDLFPLMWAEEWDKVGLVIGHRSSRIARLRLAVDPTIAEAEAAAAIPGTLLITHHPLLLAGAHFLSAHSGKGKVVTDLIASGGGLWCGHTNADRSLDGTVGAWIRALDLRNPEPIVEPAPRLAERSHEGSSTREPFGLGVVGTLATPTTVQGLASHIHRFVPSTAQGVLFTGSQEREVRTVAICPGSGDSLVGHPRVAKADVYITSDLRHHRALEHIESAADPHAVPALIDVPHYASEYIYLPHLAALLRESFPDLPVDLTSMSSDPFTGVQR